MFEFKLTNPLNLKNKSFPLANYKYNFIYNQLENNEIIEKNMTLIFTVDNFIFSDEIYINYNNYECYDDNDNRFIFYIDSIYNKYCCIKSNEDINNNYVWFENITKVYLDDELVFTNSFDHKINMCKYNNNIYY